MLAEIQLLLMTKADKKTPNVAVSGKYQRKKLIIYKETKNSQIFSMQKKQFTARLKRHFANCSPLQHIWIYL